MDDAFSVNIGKGRCGLPHQITGQVSRKLSALLRNELAQGLAIDKLHHDVELAIGWVARIKECHQVWVTNLGECSGLIMKPLVTNLLAL